MRFVVPIPLWLYIIIFLVIASLAASAIVYAIAAIAVLSLIYFAFRAPRETFFFLLFLVALKYWQVALIIAAVALVIAGIVKLVNGSKAQPEASTSGSQSMDTDPQPVESGILEMSGAMANEVSEQDRRDQEQRDTDLPRG